MTAPVVCECGRRVVSGCRCGVRYPAVVFGDSCPHLTIVAAGVAPHHHTESMPAQPAPDLEDERTITVTLTGRHVSVLVQAVLATLTRTGAPHTSLRDDLLEAEQRLRTAWDTTPSHTAGPEESADR